MTQARGVLAGLDLPFGIVTNCSEQLARRAAERLGTRPAVLVSAERAGCYKPCAAAYRLALTELGVEPKRALYVAGSPYDAPAPRESNSPWSGTTAPG